MNSTDHVGATFGENSWSLAFWNVFVGGFTEATNDALHGDYAAATIGAAVFLAKPAKAATHLHHLLPPAKRFQQFFKRAGLDIEDFKIPLDKARHTLKPDGIHTNSGGNWNKVWDGFFQANPNATKQEILDQLARMRSDFGI